MKSWKLLVAPKLKLVISILKEFGTQVDIVSMNHLIKFYRNTLEMYGVITQSVLHYVDLFPLPKNW